MDQRTPEVKGPGGPLRRVERARERVAHADDAAPCCRALAQRLLPRGT
jgi:hypothetical protein